MKNKYSFNNQEYGNCGQYALMHALALLGTPAELIDIHKATEVSPLLSKIIGTDTKYIKRGISYFHYKPIVIHTDNAEKFKRNVDDMIEKGFPLIVSTDDYDHWAVIAGNYYLVDSASGDIITKMKWEKLLKKLISYDEYFAIALYSPYNFNSIVNKMKELKKISIDNEYLFNNWGYYLADLWDIFTPNNICENPVSAENFFDNYTDELIDSIDHFYADADLDNINDVIDNYRTTAVMHNMVIPKDFEKEALIRLSVMLTCVEVFE